MLDHYKKLENMYLNAPVQEIYPGIGINVSKGRASITLPVDPKFFHAGGSLHGSVFFRLLDDAAYFSVNSLVTDVFMVTSSFHIDLLRPVSKGNLRAEGEIISSGKHTYLAKSELYDHRDKLVARGKGIFMKSQLSFTTIKGYGKIKS